MHRCLIWLRRDLRLFDNVTIRTAVEQGFSPVLSYCIDVREFSDTGLNFRKTETKRLDFLLRTLLSFREDCKAVGGTLLVRVGAPEDVIPMLAKDLDVKKVFVTEDVGFDECRDDAKIKEKLESMNLSMERVWQSSLVHEEDLPWPSVSEIPDIFTSFRKNLEKRFSIREECPPVKHLERPNCDEGDIPTLEELGYSSGRAQEHRFEAGETAAWNRLRSYIWEKDLLKVYKETRNGLLGDDYSSKMSVWLALGSISPRSIYFQVKKYERERVKNASTYWLIFELLWRDYFVFITKKYGRNIFLRNGLKGDASHLRMGGEMEKFRKWCAGETGIPFIDANMLEMYETGFMSNRGRQNVASFLVKDLGIDWTWGAKWFEAHLIDYDVASNWGNWNYVAGVGNDPRENRYFNIMVQAKRYDAGGEYVKNWLPVLKQVPSTKVHQVSTLSRAELEKYGVILGENYTRPIVNPKKWTRRRR